MATKYYSLKSRIAMINAILVVVLLIVLDFFAFVIVGMFNGQTVRSNYKTIVDTYAMFLSSSNSVYMQQIRSYSAADEMQTLDTQTKIDYVRSKVASRSKDFVFVAYVDENGIAYFDDGTQTDISSQAFCKEILSEGKNQTYAYPVQFPNYPGWVVPISKTFLKSGIPGFVMVGVPVTTYQDKIASLSMPGNGFAFLLSGNGDIMGHTDESFMMTVNMSESSALGYKNLDVLTARMLSGSEENMGSDWFTAPTTGRYFLTYCPIKSTNWAIGLAMPQSDVQAAANGLAKGIVVISAIIAILLIGFIALAIRVSLYPLKEVNAAVQQIATGEADLTKRLTSKTKSEIGALTDNFNNFMNTLQGTMTNLKDSNSTLQTAGSELKESTLKTQTAVTQINANIHHVTQEITHQSTSVIGTASAVAEIAHNINSLEQMIRKQADGVVQASDAVAHMITNIADVNKSVDSVARSFDVIEKDAVTGSEMQKAVNSRIIQIEEQSKMLKDANTAISNIAEQTNLLAMNAAIEAAHAGNAGLGFKVVADEIRKLSETSSKQSKQIGTQLQAIQELIADVGQSSSISNRTFSTVAQNIKSTNTIMHSIKATIDEQNEESEQISTALTEMTSLTSEVRHASEEMTIGNQAILEEIKELQDITDQLKTFVAEMNAGSENIQDSSQVLRMVSEKMQTVI
ncbi:MAG: methyl-accepting chemotaxis protein, partial [Treponemataceae bacterium]|nr:methyl-accepting chemotaxis protein [Treponemataceae bacterium]